MKRNEIREFLKQGADAIDIFFGSGKVTDFNSLPDKKYPFAWLESLQSKTEFSKNGSSLIDSWTVKIHIAKQDSIDSDADTYESIIDHCDDFARKLIWQYNIILSGVASTSTISSATTKDLYMLLAMSGINKVPFIKQHADCLTGVILSFTLVSPDKTDVCP